MSTAAVSAATPPARWQRAAWFAAALLGSAVAVGYSWSAFHVYRAAHLAGLSTREGLERAVALEPANAKYHDQLGLWLLRQGQDPAAALAELQKAVALNPYESGIWLDLAEAYYSAGNRPGEQAAIRRALAIDPTTPAIVWNAANFLLLDGDVSSAMQQLAVVLQHSPPRVEAALSTAWRATHDIDAVEAILPPNPNVYLQFIRLLLQQNDSGHAQQVWARMIALHRPFDPHEGFFYVDQLITEHRIAEAASAWAQLQATSPALAGYTTAGNAVTDGGFAQPLLNAGFDWRYAANPATEISLDQTAPEPGGRSLLITYNGSTGDAGIFQYVPVEPDTSYQLSAIVRSEDLLTANGPRLAVTDDATPPLHAATAEVSGTTEWHQLATTFRTGRNTRLLRLAIERDPAVTQIRGRLWVTSIVVRPANP